jgi:hypothetical protein
MLLERAGWVRSQDSDVAAVGNKGSMASVAGRSSGSHRERAPAWGPQLGGGGGDGYGYMGWAHCNTLRPSCNSVGTYWGVRLVGYSGENTSPGSWEGGLQVQRGSGGPHFLRENRDGVAVVPDGILRPGMDRAPPRGLLCLQNTARTAGRQSCLVRMGTATKERSVWRRETNRFSTQHWIFIISKLKSHYNAFIDSILILPSHFRLALRSITFS